ncbi:MAG: hypothetical protein JNJ40_02640 [Bacteroidia bacterium]|nr:hypothetical protein [Bacteroidia bacterium]
MKNLLLVLTICLSVNTIKATETGADKNKLVKKIQTALSTPESVKHKNKSEKITVYFCVNAEGKVIEVNAKTSNKDIKQHLEKEFLTLTLQDLKPCVTNTIDINYVIY